LFLREDYPPFDFQPAANDDGVDPHAVLALTCPETLNRWKPLCKWFRAIPHYVVLVGLMVAAAFVIRPALGVEALSTRLRDEWSFDRRRSRRMDGG
jgi:hypothetical protein